MGCQHWGHAVTHHTLSLGRNNHLHHNRRREWEWEREKDRRRDGEMKRIREWERENGNVFEPQSKFCDNNRYLNKLYCIDYIADVLDTSNRRKYTVVKHFISYEFHLTWNRRRLAAAFRKSSTVWASPRAMMHSSEWMCSCAPSAIGMLTLSIYLQQQQ